MNQVTLDPDGFIRQTLVGKQDEVTISELEIRTRELIKQIQGSDHGHTVNFLVDLHRVGRQTVSARRTSLAALRNLPYHKIALFGAHRFIRHVVNLVIIASGQHARVRQFGDEAAAVAWLKKK